MAEIRGDRPLADALIEAARHVDGLDAGARREMARALRRGPTAGTVLPEAATDAARELIINGTDTVTTRELARLPGDLACLLAARGLDPAAVIQAHRRHGIVSGADLAAAIATAAADEPEIAELAPWLPWLAECRQRMPLGRALGVVEEIERQLDQPDAVGRLHVLGSVRRFEPTVGDLDLLLVHASPAEALARAVERLAPADVRHLGARRAVVSVGRNEVSLRAAPLAEAPFLQLWHTGSAPHVVGLRRHAAAQQLDLRPLGLRAGDGTGIACESESAIYDRLGLQFVPPELRHGEDEIDRARRHELPSLVEQRHIRGDLHTHTLWSDGRDSVAAMVHAARALGYDYVAITDHSPSAAAARVLTLERIEQQWEEVRRVRLEVPGITVLYGVEVDILADGSLDLPDDLLARLDLVLASLHESHGHSADRLLARYARAMQSPYVHVITHPANRLVGCNQGYALDYDALFALAVDTGTALEIDGGPGHLDLDGHLARRAVAAGVTLTIDSDCHHAIRLARQMRMGVGTARRGGVEPRHVLNTRRLPEVLAFFAAKRDRMGARR